MLHSADSLREYSFPINGTKARAKTNTNSSIRD